MRTLTPARLAAVALLAVLAACSDFLAAPAPTSGPARLVLGSATAETHAQVDGLRVILARGGTVVVDTSFAVSAGAEVIRQTLDVELREPREELSLRVEMRWRGTTRFAGDTTVRLLRGAWNTAEITLRPVGTLSVVVANALTGQPLAGARVIARAGANAPATTPVAATQITGSTGQARFDALPAGPYTLFVSAPALIEAVEPGVVVAEGGETTRNVALSPVLAAGETRIVLTWGAAPSDLDAHLTGPNGAGGRFHVHFSGTTYQSPSSPTLDVLLDVDETSGFGPETVTIRRQFAGSYCYSVHNYSGGSGLGASGAQVKVFRGSQQVGTFAVPPTTRQVWTVFQLDGSTVTPVNTTGDAVPGSCP